MSYTPSPDNQKKRAVLRGIEKQIFTVVAEETDRRWKWLLPIMKKVALREENSAKSTSSDIDSDSEDPDSVGAFEDQMFDCAAVGTRDEWEEFLRVPVERAAFAGRKDLVERLTLAGAPSERVMIEATRGGQDRFIFDMLLVIPRYRRVGTDEGGNTALHIAAKLGHEQILRALLLDRAPADVLNYRGVAPLHLAIRGGHLSVVKALLLAGATAKLRQGLHEEEYEPTQEWEELLIDEDGPGESPFLLAVSSGKNRLAIMRELLRQGAMLDDGEHVGITALHESVNQNVPDVLNFLLEAGASVQDEDDGNIYSPLSKAASKLAHGMALSLLKHGFKVNVVEYNGETALHLAVGRARSPGCAEMVDLLLRWGADETGEQVDGACLCDWLVFLLI